MTVERAAPNGRCEKTAKSLTFSWKAGFLSSLFLPLQGYVDLAWFHPPELCRFLLKYQAPEGAKEREGAEFPAERLRPEGGVGEQPGQWCP